MRVALFKALLAIGMGVVASPTFAAETITYTYDARGRIVTVVHSGTVNNGVATIYTHDAADNRTEIKTTGATN